MGTKDSPSPESFLREISDLMVPVTISTEDTGEINDCRLIYYGRGKDLLVRVASSNLPRDKGRIDISCAHRRSLCLFKSYIIGHESSSPDNILLRITYPDLFATEDRRKYVRVRPSNSNPVRVLVPILDSKVIDVETIDVSTHGIAFVLPENLVTFKLGVSFSIIANFPGNNIVHTIVTAKNISRLFNMVRVGMEFSQLSKEEEELLNNYVAKREEEIYQEQRTKQHSKKTSIVLLEQNKYHSRYDFLNSTYKIEKCTLTVSPDNLITHDPDVIVISDSDGSAMKIAKAIRLQPGISPVPLILLSQIETDDMDIPLDTTVLNSPFSEKILITVINDLAKQYKFYRYVRQKRLTVISGKPKKAFVIDRFHNFGDDNAHALATYGFTVNMRRKEEGIPEVIEKFQPDIILIDEEMEHTDPVSLCRQIRSDDSICSIPRIIMTKQKRTYERFYSHELFSAYILKPLNTEDLVSTVLETISANSQ